LHEILSDYITDIYIPCRLRNMQT